MIKLLPVIFIFLCHSLTQASEQVLTCGPIIDTQASPYLEICLNNNCGIQLYNKKTLSPWF
jgi:hypothetical protein